MQIEGRCAVVTGGGGGIGRALGLELARRGADVVVADVRGEAAAAVAKQVQGLGRRALGLACDLTEDGAIEALAERAWDELGGVDLLVNNAGVGKGSPLLDGDAENLRWILEVNVVALWQGCARFGRRFAEQGTPAWIVNVGSEHSLGFPHPGMGFYTASKHAVLGLSDVLRHELPAHVGISVLCPGLVATEFWDSTRTRPPRFGGSEPGDPLSKQVTAHGKSPDEIARRCLDGVEAGEFLIPTHAVARRYAETRWNEIAGAFDRQCRYTEDDEQFDVTRVVQKVLGQG